MSKPTKKTKSTEVSESPPPSLTPADKGRMALLPSLNSASVSEAYQGNVMGKEADIEAMIEQVRETFKEVRSGDLHTMEAMLVGQATALQTVFTSLARRAAVQVHLPQYQAFLGLALKAQSQSRATIATLVDLKYPRQATFVKQANIANGPQQVNNSARPPNAIAHGRETATAPNELLEDSKHGGTYLDTRTAATPTRGDTAMETVESVHRPHKSRRKRTGGS